MQTKKLTTGILIGALCSTVALHNQNVLAYHNFTETCEIGISTNATVNQVVQTAEDLLAHPEKTLGSPWAETGLAVGGAVLTTLGSLCTQKLNLKGAIVGVGIAAWAVGSGLALGEEGDDEIAESAGIAFPEGTPAVEAASVASLLGKVAARTNLSHEEIVFAAANPSSKLARKVMNVILAEVKDSGILKQFENGDLDKDAWLNALESI